MTIEQLFANSNIQNWATKQEVEKVKTTEESITEISIPPIINVKQTYRGNKAFEVAILSTIIIVLGLVLITANQQ